MLRIRMLGSLEAELDGVAVPLGGPRQRAVLARLLAARGQIVPVDGLIDDLWEDAAPRRATVSLQAYVSNLRRVLEPGRPPRAPALLIVSAAPGYALRLPPGTVDAWEFEQQADAARRAAEHGRAAEAGGLLDGALALWRGPVLADGPEQAWAAPEIARLGELRSSARELRAVLALRTGDPELAAASAERLTREEPLREEGWRLRALALWSAGRRADALEALRHVRTLLAEELGLDPGPALAELHDAILNQRTEYLSASEVAAPRLPGGGGVFGPEEQERNGTTPTPFLGRDAELAALLAAARSAPGTALVTGEAGQGKSTMLARTAQLLTGEGWSVVSGACPEADGAPPAWPWATALRGLARTDPPPAALAGDLAPLLADHTTTPADSAAGRFRLHRAVRGWLRAAARSRPTAVLLDDLHWADPATLALLAACAEGPPTCAPLLLIAAYRPEEAGPRLADTLAALARSTPAPVRLPLDGLAAPAVARLVQDITGRPVDPEALAALAERTGGNPFYVLESARLLRSEGELVALSEVPEGVRDVLRRRVARLPTAQVAVLRLAAVAGREAEVEVLVEAADAEEDGVLDALESGLLAGLLHEPRPGRIGFVHALVQDTMTADLSGIRASRMHARIAAARERLDPADVSALAHHYGLAATPGTAAKAVEFGIRAADLAERRYAHGTAVELLERAVESFRRLPPPTLWEAPHGPADRAARRTDLLGRLLRAQLRAGAVAAARETRARAVRHAADVGRDELLIAAYSAWSVPTQWQVRAYGEVDRAAVAELHRLLQLPVTAPGFAPEARCRLLGAYADELSGEGDPSSRAAAEEALALAEGLGDPALLALTLVTLERQLDIDRESVRRAAVGRELARLGDTHDLPFHRFHGRYVQATAAAADNDPGLTRRLVEEALRLARDYRMAEQQGVAECALAVFEMLAGRYAQAREGFAGAASRLVRDGSLHGAGHLRMAEVSLLAAEGRLAELAEQAEDLYAAFGPAAVDLAALALAEAGRPEEARRMRERAEPVRRDYFYAVFSTFRAQAVLAVGDLDTAARLYTDLLPYRDDPPAGTTSLSLALPPMADTLARLARALGRETEAKTHAERAAEVSARWRGGS